MSLSEGQLGSFGQLAKALGILDAHGDANPDWFSDPVGNGSGAHGLRQVLADDGQRDALIAFVDGVLGPPDRATHEDAVWVPLFRETSPQVTIFAVIKPIAGAVHLGIGIEHSTTGAAPTVTTRVHAPVFQLARGTSPAPPAVGDVPGWLLLGRTGGRVEVSVDATLRSDSPPPGQPSLGGLSLSLAVPTAAADELAVRLDLRDLQLPGAAAPRTFTLDASSLDELGPDVFELIVGLVRAQADAIDVTQAALRPFAAFTGLLGLRTVAGLPPLPLSELPTAGVQAIVGWLESILATNAARDAWLGQLTLLLGPGATLDAARDAVGIAIGPAHLTLGVRVASGSGGHPILTPWAEVALSPSAGATARASVDLLRADTSTGAVTAIPDLRIEAVFGADAGGGALLSGTPQVGSLHVGLGLNEARRPTFLLTLHDVTIAGRPPYAVLDLSSPQAALDTASGLIDGALTAALANLGGAGALVAQLIGSAPPTGVPALEAVALLSDPIGAIARYWQALTSSAAGMGEVLGALRRLIAGGAVGSAPGTGTALTPWLVDFAPGVGLRFWLDAGVLVVDVGADVVTPVLGDLQVSTKLALTLLRASFTPPSARFGVEGRAAITLERADHQPARLALGQSLQLSGPELGAVVSWTAARGLRLALEADGLALTIQERGVTRSVALPLPTFDAAGELTFVAPAWDDVEGALAGLLGSLQVPVIDAAVSLLGWVGGGPRLSLAGLFGGNPELQVEAWLADLLLDCDRLSVALGPIASLLSGFSINRPLGSGSARSPYRCPVAGQPLAPGLAAWLVPGCPPRLDNFATPLSGFTAGLPPEPSALVGALAIAARTLPDIADLLVGRDSLEEGLRLLGDRWAGTDGLVGIPAVLPDDVTSLVLDGYCYDELVALGSRGTLASDAFDALPSAIVHVGCEETWSRERAAGTAFDTTTAGAAQIPATGGGTWFVRLPAPAAAQAARPDRGAVGEQAARLSAVLGARTAPIAIVAYGAAGAAAVRAASTIAAVSDVVTVGTPWAGLAVDSLRTGTSGDALVLLRRLLRTDAVKWSDQLWAVEGSPLQMARGVVARSVSVVADSALLPSADLETRRAGLRVRAVFGALDADALAIGMGALFVDGITARAQAARGAAAPAVLHTELHVGVDLPVVDANFDGLLVGIGAVLELAALEHSGGEVRASVARGLLLELHCGVHDGWLVGGPGATSRDVDVRWLSIHLQVPFDGRAGDGEIVLHEARAFSAYRERWVVRADALDVDSTTVLPEVRVMLSGVVGRLRAASPDLGRLLELVGLARDGGLDPDGVDRLIHDAKTTILAACAAAPADLAEVLRRLVPGASGSGAALAVGVGPASVSVDLAARTLSATVTAREPGLPPIDVALTFSSTAARAELGLGALDEHAGGVRLLARAGAGSDVALEWQAPGAAVRRLALLPTFDPAALTPFVTVALPAALAQALASYCRARASVAGRAALDSALSVLGLLGAADLRGERAVLLPLGLLNAPGDWLRRAVEGWRTDPVGSATTLLDALLPLIAPTRPTGERGWPLGPGVTVDYRAENGSLQLAADVALSATVDGTAVTSELLGGLRLSASGPPLPVLAATIGIAGRGVRIDLAPQLRISLLRPSPAVPLEIFPNGPGLNDALQAVGDMVLPPVLNALAAHRNDAAASLLKNVGAAVFDLGTALELMEGAAFTAGRLDSFAADPAARLVARLPQLVSAGAAALAHALDPTATLVHVTGPTAGRLTLGFGATEAVRVVLDAATGTPAIELRMTANVPGFGPVALEMLRMSADGVQVAGRFGPTPLRAGALELRPMVVVKAGVASGSFTRMLGLDLALDATGEDAIEFRWTLDERPPSLVVVSRPPAGTELVDSDPRRVALRLLALGASLATGVLVDALGPVLTADAKAILRGVVFTDVAASTSIDPEFFIDLFEPIALLSRLERLLWNAATGPTPLSLTIDGKVTIGLGAKDGVAGAKQLGVNVSLAPGQRFAIATGDPQVDLEIDASWVDPSVLAGLSIFVIEGKSGAGGLTFEFSPAVAISGLGLRFSKTSGPLLALGEMSLDSIAVHLYGEAGASGLGGGAQIELGGLAIAPGGAGGTNQVANGILNDAGASSAANRPTFSPALAIQQHPGETGVSVSLRAGPPPGPWWLVVQRQLGPLYVERVGFDSVEQNGRVSQISVLFDGRVSLFGLTASVDQLAMKWLGGDVASAGSWAVDLQGLAVSADMSGVSLSGGLLKSTAGDGQISYVGMLMGRFGIYGLSVFGGYTDDHGSPSFFVFGAINGPIGGPPAFFVTGIGGGLGINRGLRVPDDLARFNEYPFIQALDPAAHPPADPMAELRKLGDYFPPLRGNFWFAAGISFTCFALVDGIAVLSVSFGDGLEINLLGLARMALPRPGAALVSIELGLLARFSTKEGLFSIRAQLTENSWLLYSDVRLTGGFAFVVWWKGANRGQFVLTMGGYHPSFHRDGYPEVPRLGLVWHVSDQIVIKGGSYFALTSEALMAGTEVEVSVDFGFVWARIAFGANGIVYFDPFWFEVDAYARISAGVKIETWFGTISFGVSLGAQIMVQGPDFSGRATFEVGPVSVTVPFGSERVIAAKRLPWAEFVGKYLEEDNGSARVLSAITGRGALPSATKGEVAAPTADGSLARPFEVFAEFELSVVTTVPTQAIDVGLTTGPVNAPVVRSDGATGVLGLKPMEASELASTLALTLEQKVAGSYGPAPERLRKLAANLGAAVPRAEGSSVSKDAFPIGAWGEPDSSGNDKPLPKGEVLFAANGVRLVAEAELTHRGPEIDYYRVEAGRRPLPLQAGGPARSSLLARAAEVTATFPVVTSAAQALGVARSGLFAAAAAPPEGVLARGQHSNLARAAFAGDRVAPPLFGSLADGLAVANGADGVATRQAPPPPPSFAGLRPPVVTAWLTSGAGVAERAALTSVKDRRTKRRVAPSLDSVQARMALHLPVQLAVTPLPARQQGKTVIATGATPRTDAIGAARTYRAGVVGGSRGLDRLVGGLGSATATRDVAEVPPLLAPGDLLVLSLRDASVDADPQRRPLLVLSDEARVTMLKGNGSVVHDDGRKGEVVVPPGVALVGVQVGTLTDVERGVGMAGWHAGARVASLGAHAALGAGCVLNIEAVGTGPGVRWAAAADVVAGAAAVVTRFGRSARTVVVVLADAALERLDSAELELIGAEREQNPDGTPLAPVVVLRGAEASLIYALRPGQASGFMVRVRAGGGYRLAGVLAGDFAADELARRIADRGALSLACRLLAAGGAGVRVTYRPPASGAKAVSEKAPQATKAKPAKPKPAATKAKRAKPTVTKAKRAKPKPAAAKAKRAVARSRPKRGG